MPTSLAPCHHAARRAAIAVLVGAGCVACSTPAAAQPECGDDGAWRVALSAGLGVVAGAAGGVTSSGVISLSDDTREYEFYVGALVSVGVTTGLSAIYAIYDGSFGCQMANEGALGVVWSVPIVTLLLGAALPIAIWGAADEVGAAPPPDEMMSSGMRGPSWGFRF